MIPSCLQLRALFFLNAFGNFASAEYAKIDAPLAQNPQKILNSGIHKHCSMKTFRIREENPAAWYSNNARQPVITPNALSQSIK
jgi:hypothetical protein